MAASCGAGWPLPRLVSRQSQAPLQVWSRLCCHRMPNITCRPYQEIWYKYIEIGQLQKKFLYRVFGLFRARESGVKHRIPTYWTKFGPQFKGEGKNIIAVVYLFDFSHLTRDIKETFYFDILMYWIIILLMSGSQCGSYETPASRMNAKNWFCENLCTE